jgi:hypothetical protein
MCPPTIRFVRDPNEGTAWMIVIGADTHNQRPTLVARKLRTLELRAGAPHACTTSTTPRASTAMGSTV